MIISINVYVYVNKKFRSYYEDMYVNQNVIVKIVTIFVFRQRLLFLV